MDPTTGRATRLDRLLAIGFVLCCLIPGLALLAGARPPDLDNAAPASLPPLTAGTVLDRETYAGVETYVAKNLPGRNIALRAYAALDYGLLRGTSSSQVVVGRDDWLFFDGELRPQCARSADDLLAGLDQAAAAGRAAGIDVWLTVAPDKHAIYPEMQAPDRSLATPCTDVQRPAMEAGMAARPDRTIDLWAPLEARKAEAAADGDPPLYFSQDSHWTPTGALAAIGQVVQTLAPGVWDPAAITATGETTYPMELARLMGLPRSARIPAYTTRPDVRVSTGRVDTPVHLANAKDISDYRVRGDHDVVPGTTLILYDSFFNINRLRITPWFEHTIWLPLEDLRDQPQVAASLPPIDRVVVERVERSAYNLDLPTILAPVFAHQAAAPSPGNAP